MIQASMRLAVYSAALAGGGLAGVGDRLSPP